MTNSRHDLRPPLDPIEISSAVGAVVAMLAITSIASFERNIVDAGRDMMDRDFQVVRRQLLAA